MRLENRGQATKIQIGIRNRTARPTRLRSFIAACTPENPTGLKVSPVAEVNAAGKPGTGNENSDRNKKSYCATDAIEIIHRRLYAGKPDRIKGLARGRSECGWKTGDRQRKSAPRSGSSLSGLRSAEFRSLSPFFRLVTGAGLTQAQLGKLIDRKSGVEGK